MEKSATIISLFIWLNVLGLVFTATNKIPISVIPFVFAAVLLPFGLWETGRDFLVSRVSVPRITIYAFLYYAVSFVSAFYYDVHALFDASFYRWDGNLFVSFLPLLLLNYYRNDLNLTRVLGRIVIVWALISAFAVIGQLINPASKWITGAYNTTNGFGGFLMSAIAASLALYLYSRKYIYIFMLICFFVLLGLSQSRGSMLGIFCGIFGLLLIRTGRARYVIYIFALMVAVQASILMATFPVYQAFSGDTNAVTMVDNEEFPRKQSNIYQRIFQCWPRAIYMFINSPVLGVGVGAMDDLPAKFNSNDYFQINASEVKIHGNNHAHHSYLHILGEQGIVGLLLFALLWLEIFRWLSRANQVVTIQWMLIISYLALTFSALTEHRIPSPSNAFPFFILFALYYGYSLNQAVMDRETAEDSLP